MPEEAKRPVPLDEQLCYAIWSASIAIQRAYKPLLDELGLTYPQYLVLNVLWREDERSVGSIATELALDPSTLTPLLKRLEGVELVRRRRNPRDDRRVIVALTEKGRAMRRRTSGLTDQLLITTQQSAEELSELTTKVRALRDAIYASIEAWSEPD